MRTKRKILTEKRIALGPQEKQMLQHVADLSLQKIAELTPEVVNEKGYKKTNHAHWDWVTWDKKYNDAEGNPCTIAFAISYSDNDEGAWCHPGKPDDANDQVIYLNWKYFYPLVAKSSGGLDDGAQSRENLKTRAGKFFLGLDSIRNQLLSTLYHEFIHAKDPIVLSHGVAKSGFALPWEDIGKYYGSDVEFVTYTGEFLEAVEDRFDYYSSKKLTSDEWQIIYDTAKYMGKYFDGQDIPANAKKHIHLFITDDKANILQKAIRGIYNFVRKNVMSTKEREMTPSGELGLLDTYVARILAIKQYAPEKYEDFIKEFSAVLKKGIEKVNKNLKDSEKLKQESLRLYIRSVINETFEINNKEKR